jgi:hypothetical protein
VVFQNYRTIGSNSLKKSELNEPLVWVISKTKGTSSFHERTDGLVSPIVGYLIFQFLRTMVIHHHQVFEVFENHGYE